MIINNNVGEVVVRDNVVRNMNSKGIFVNDNYETAEIHVVGNTVISEVYGSYPYSSHMAGVGVFAQSTWIRPEKSGARVEIVDNEIRCDKLNYCGIAVYGQSRYEEGASKLGECIVRDNNIHLGDGSVGVLIRKNDRTEVVDNKISGKAYYGFHLWGSEDREGFDLGSNDNLIEDNDLSDLEIKTPDEYSDSHVDGRMFTGSGGRSATAHVWLNAHSRGNAIKIKTDETVIDEGEDNTITFA
jgi:nitrous oxidase accessory protein NosD